MDARAASPGPHGPPDSAHSPRPSTDQEEALRALALFEGLTEQELAKLLSVARRKRVQPDTVIVREGEHSSSLYVLTSGAVLVSKRLGLALARQADEETSKTLIRLAAPRFFGEMALLGDTERSATIVALGECELLEISKPDFERLVEADHRLGYRLVRNIAVDLCARMRRTDRDVLKLTIALSLALGNRA